MRDGSHASDAPVSLLPQREEDPDTYSNFYYTVGHNDVSYFMLVSCIRHFVAEFIVKQQRMAHCITFCTASALRSAGRPSPANRLSR